MEEIVWPKSTNPDQKINLVADKVNELVKAYNMTNAHQCQHTNATQLKNGTWHCPDCKRFIKPPHG